jgi:hypothetical protein
MLRDRTERLVAAMGIVPALLALACGSGSKAAADGSPAPPDSASPDSSSATGDAAGSTGGTGGGPVTIAIVSPTSPAYTNKTITIQVSVGDTSGAAHAVRLLYDGATLTDIGAPPYTFDWNTTTVTEKSYQLVAQTTAGGETVASAPVTIVVDRTPPTIVSKAPDSGASNVSLTDPIQIVFSEALAPTSVSAGAVALALTGAPVATTATLGNDGKTVAIALADRSSLALPGTMTETVSSSITDLAGNAFAGAMWSYAVPLWVDLGTVAGIGPQMVLDASGEPTVATWVNGAIKIARHTGGTSWDTSIPSPQTSGQLAGIPGFGSTKAGLFLAWNETVASSVPVHVARWTGTAWDTSYGTLLTTLGDSTTSLAIAFTAAGQPVVRWDESSLGTNHRGHVARWTGSAWSTYPDFTMGTCDMSPCRIAVDSSDFPVVEANLRISRWNGSSWTALPGTGAGNGLVLDSAQQAIAFRVSQTLEVIAVSPAGVASTYLPVLNSAPMSPAVNQAGQVALASGDRPIVTWLQYDGPTTTDPTTSDLHVAGWTGTAWDAGYGVFHSANGNCALALVGNTVPIVAWEDVAGTLTHVSKSNH